MRNPNNVDRNLAAKQVHLLLLSIRLERLALKIFGRIEDGKAQEAQEGQEG